MGVFSKERRDYYYFQAKVLGFRARSAFKLLDINRTFNIFQDVTKVIDLCAAPGSWSQVLKQETTAEIISIDIQEMQPIEGVHTLVEDITSEECMKKINDIFKGEKADLIVCDGAPDVTGFHDLDEFLQTDLLKAALSICQKAGREGSTFVGKCFRGEFSGYIMKHFMKFYKSVEIVKPQASRNVSVECFFVCREMIRIDDDPLVFDDDCDNINFEVKVCGNGPDPDFINQNITGTYEPIAPPIAPPYQSSIELRNKKVETDNNAKVK